MDRFQPSQQEVITDFLEGETSDLNRSQRVVLIAEAYDYEVLVTARWLYEIHHVDIACYQIALATEGCLILGAHSKP